MTLDISKVISYVIRCGGSDQRVGSNRETSHIPTLWKEKSPHSSSSTRTFRKSNCQHIAHFPTFLKNLATFAYKFVKNREIMRRVPFHGLQRGSERASSHPRKAFKGGRNGAFTLLERPCDNLNLITWQSGQGAFILFWGIMPMGLGNGTRHISLDDGLAPPCQTGSRIYFICVSSHFKTTSLHHVENLSSALFKICLN